MAVEQMPVIDDSGPNTCKHGRSKYVVKTGPVYPQRLTLNCFFDLIQALPP